VSSKAATQYNRRGGSGSHGRDVVVQAGLEPAIEVLTSTDPSIVRHLRPRVAITGPCT